MQLLRRGLRITGAATAAASAGAFLLYRYERSRVPPDCELVCASETEQQTKVLKRLSADNLMGGFDAYYLNAVWFYDAPLDAASIKQTLAQAVTEMPALAGRRCEDGIVLSNAGARFTATTCEGSAHDWLGTGLHVEAQRGDFADVPSACTGGEQPLFTVRVTNFQDGTSAIGIAAPHSLMDGKSYFAVVEAIAAAHAQGGSFRGVRVPDFDAARVWEDCTRAVDVNDLQTTWVSFRLLEWTIGIWALAMPRIDSLLPRARVRLSQSDLQDLKSAVSGALGRKEACTTNEALSAAFMHALADSPTGPFTTGQAGIVRMVVNAQGKGVFAGVHNVAGNFSWMVDDRTPKPPSEMSMAEAASFFRALGAKWRDETSAAACVDEFAKFHRVQDVKGFLWDQTDSVDNTLFLNNQTVYPVTKILFGKGALVGFHPWHSHNHLVFYEAPAEPGSKPGSGRFASGVDVYLPKMYSPLLGTEQFKKKLLYGWRDGEGRKA